MILDCIQLNTFNVYIAYGIQLDTIFALSNYQILIICTKKCQGLKVIKKITDMNNLSKTQKLIQDARAIKTAHELSLAETTEEEFEYYLTRLADAFEIFRKADAEGENRPLSI